MYYNITYISPSGSIGTMYALKANSLDDAIKDAPYWLSASSQFSPSDFRVTGAYETPEYQLPRKE